MPLTEFRPLSPKQALDLANAAEIADAEKLIRDFAAAGLVKSYAAVVDTIAPEGGKTTVRDATLPTDLWDRLIEEGRDADVWTGGTVRLQGAELVGGKPAVKITAIGFNPGDLERMIDRHLGRAQQHRSKPKPRQDALSQTETGVALAGVVAAKPSGLAAIPEGAVTVTMKQAMAALGLGRTTIDKLCGEGRLDRRKVGARALITVASIRELLG